MALLCVFASALLLAGLSYFQFPGHRYLESDTQIYVPMFERFENPALFERDPMVARPHTAFTLYDELTLGLGRVTGLGLEAVLGIVHVAVRVSLVYGIFLITRAMGLSPALALACAGVYALGGWVRGPAVLLVEYEPVPRAFALGPTLLAIGLAAHRRYLAAGVAGAIAFLLHATTSGPFWTVFAILLFVPDEPEEIEARLRGLLALAVAAVSLKIAAALQPGLTEPQAFLGRLDATWEKLIRMRSAYLFVSLWPSLYFWQYGMMLAAGVAAYRRLRWFMQPALRFFVAGLAALGVASGPASYLLLEKLKWAITPQVQPLRTILFVELFAMLLALVMAFELACREGRIGAGAWWAAFGLAIGIDARLLFVLTPLALAWLTRSPLRWAGLAASLAIGWAQPFGLAVWKGTLRQELLLAVALGLLLVEAAELSTRRRALGTSAVAAVVLAAFFLIPGKAQLQWSGQPKSPELEALSEWAQAQADPSAVFLFPEAQRGAVEPGIFRARAERALYVDWKGGGQVNFFRQFARIWWSRWLEAMREPLGPEDLPRFRELGIDYVVLSPGHRLPARKAAFENSRYVVYRTE